MPLKRRLAFLSQEKAVVPVEIDAGDVAFFHGYTLHRSLNNTRKDGFSALAGQSLYERALNAALVD